MDRAYWEELGIQLNDNLNWNVCLDVIERVKMGLCPPDVQYDGCVAMIKKYKTRERYFKRKNNPNRVNRGEYKDLT